MLGVTPTKWIGRYIVDLEDFTDVPDWAPPMYEQQEGVEWRFTGPGILLVSEDGKIIILDSSHRAFQRHKIRRVGADKICGGFTEQSLVGFGQSGVSANYRVSADMPDIS